MPELMSFEIDDVVILRFPPISSADQFLFERFGREMVAIAAANPGGKLLLDLAGLQVANSTLFAQILSLHRQCKADNTALKLCAMSAQMSDVLRMMRLDRLFEIHAEQDEALAAFENAKPA